MRRTIVSSLAVFLCTLAFAQASSPDALFERGIDSITGVGSTRNDAQGLDYFRQASDLGYGPAQIALAYFYETGTIVAADQSKALELYRKAALSGDPLASWLVGRIYLLGNGVPRDLEAAQKWLKTSAGQNNAYGAYYLARLMADRDAAKSAALYKVAADQGLPQAQFFYGKALREGKGVASDPQMAYVWLNIAADAGYSQALSEMNDLTGDGHLSLDQIAVARAKAHEMEQLVIRAVTSRGCSGWDGEFDELPTPPPPRLQRYCH